MSVESAEQGPTTSAPAKVDQGRDVNNDVDTAAKYRKRAEELRQIAEAVKDEASRKSILEIVGDYEKMARSRERLDTIGRHTKER